MRSGTVEIDEIILAHERLTTVFSSLLNTIAANQLVSPMDVKIDAKYIVKCVSYLQKYRQLQEAALNP